jgi:hypothetical protein
MRQPVMAQFLEKVWTNITRSSGAMMSRKEGERPSRRRSSSYTKRA